MGSLIDKLILLERWESPERRAAAARRSTSACSSPTLVAPIADAHPQRRFAVSTPHGILAAIDPDRARLRRDKLRRQRREIRPGEISVTRRRCDAAAASSRSPTKARASRSTDAARVFDRFYRGAQRDVAGSGLGLGHRQSAPSSARTARFRSTPARTARASPCGFRWRRYRHKKVSRPGRPNPRPRRGGRVVEGTRLESGRTC